MRLQFPVQTFFLIVGLLPVVGAVGCSSGKANPEAEAPPKAVVEPDLDANNFRVDNPDRFPLTTAAPYKSVPALNVTGTVQPDIARAVPVVSLASGRVVEIKAKLGDAVEKGGSGEVAPLPVTAQAVGGS